MITVNRSKIKKLIKRIELITAVERGFEKYSKGMAIVPMPGHLDFTSPPGNVHIKYGAIRDEKTFTVKISNGFFDNPKIGLSSSQGLVLVFSQKTGVLEAILFDEGLVTDLRTAAAGAVVAKYLAPTKIQGVGVIGTGIQARLQIEYLTEVLNFNEIFVYGRNPNSINNYINDMKARGISARSASSVDELVEKTNYIITTTPSKTEFLFPKHYKPGLHITAMGADGQDKHEVSSKLLAMANVKVVDSKEQCFRYSDTSYAVSEKLVQKKEVLEIGEIINNKKLGRINNNQFTFADLTGVAVQDIVAAELILDKLNQEVA
jgi:ornithine cyclodeaminase